MATPSGLLIALKLIGQGFAFPFILVLISDEMRGRKAATSSVGSDFLTGSFLACLGVLVFGGDRSPLVFPSDVIQLTAGLLLLVSLLLLTFAIGIQAREDEQAHWRWATDHPAEVRYSGARPSQPNKFKVKFKAMRFAAIVILGLTTILTILA